MFTEPSPPVSFFPKFWGQSIFPLHSVEEGDKHIEDTKGRIAQVVTGEGAGEPRESIRMPKALGSGVIFEDRGFEGTSVK